MNNVHEIAAGVFNDLASISSQAAGPLRDMRFANDVLERHGDVKLVELCILANMFGGRLRVSIEPVEAQP